MGWLGWGVAVNLGGVCSELVLVEYLVCIIWLLGWLAFDFGGVAMLFPCAWCLVGV